MHVCECVHMFTQTHKTAKAISAGGRVMSLAQAMLSETQCPALKMLLATMETNWS